MSTDMTPDHRLQKVESPYLLWLNSGGKKKRFTLEIARRTGAKVILVNREQDVPPRLFEHFVQADTAEPQAVLGQLAKFQEDHPDISFAGAITFWEDDVPLLAQVCEDFGLIGNSHQTAIKTRNKYEMRNCFAETGLSSPKYHLVKSEADVRDAIERIGFPAVMKPVWGADSEFVVLVKTETDALSTWAYLKQNCTEAFNSIFKVNAGLFLYEQYVDGIEVSVECFSQYGIPHVLGINEKQPIRPPYFVEQGDICPARLDPKTAYEVEKLAESALIALGVHSSLSHIELKVGNNGPTLIEVASRMGGDDVYQNIKTVYGHDLIRIGIQIALGQQVKFEKHPPKGCVVSRYFIPENSGIITSIADSSSVKKSSQVVELVINKEVGNSLLTPPEGFENVGWVITRGNSYQEAETALEEVTNKIEINVTPFRKKSAVGSSLLGDSLRDAVTVRSEILRDARMRRFRERSEQTSLSVGLIIDPASAAETSRDAYQKEILGIEQALQQLGHTVSRIQISVGTEFLEKLQKTNPEICVFCLPAQRMSVARIHLVAGLLEFLGIPLVGADSTALDLSRDLVLTRKLFEYHEIPAPEWDYVVSPGEYVNEALEYPLVTRALNINRIPLITPPRLATNPSELSAACEQILSEKRGPVLIEEFIEGDLFDIFLVGNHPELTVLPPYKQRVEVIDGALFTNPVGSTSKRRSLGFPTASAKQLQLLTELALDVYQLFDCRDYGQVQILVDRMNNPYVLNVIANPSLSPHGSFALCARQDQYSFNDLLEEIVSAALCRLQPSDSSATPRSTERSEELASLRSKEGESLQSLNGALVKNLN